MLAFHKDINALLYKKLQWYISNNYVKIFGYLQKSSHLFLYVSYSQHQMIASPFIFGLILYLKILEIYVHIYVPLLKLSYCFWESYRIQNLKLDNPDNNNISIHGYNQELLPTTRLILCLFIIRSTTQVNLIVIADI